MPERRRSIGIMSPGLLKVVERAQDPTAQFNSLAHHIDEDALRRAFHRIRKNSAAGVDGVTKDMYGQELAKNVNDLHHRLRWKTYRHQPIRRVHIPKGGGTKQTRPIGISTLEDKIVQGALSELLSFVYEPLFSASSYGFRPGRGAHDALRAVNQMAFHEGIGWILESDIQAFFDSIDRAKLREMLRERVVDGSFLRLVGKCLHVGVLDGVEFSSPDEGTTQGSVISPLLGNIYLHHVLDVWFEHEVAPRLRGHARLVRYADDFVIGFEHRDDAVQVLAALRERMAAYSLMLHPEKTRLIPFGRPSRNDHGKKGPATFDFLGFTIHWRRSRKGMWALAMTTRKVSFQKGLRSIGEWCRRHRHLPLRKQHEALVRRVRGHLNYFAVQGNGERLKRFLTAVERIWLKWLQRRSQRARRYTWEKFRSYLETFPLPHPRIRHRIWGAAP